jgi:hypothetical protein
MRRASKHLQRLKDNWDGHVHSKWITGVFQSPASQFEKPPPHSSQPNNYGRWLAETSLIPEDDLPRNGQIPDDFPRMAKSRKMTYQEWLNPGKLLTEKSQISAYDKPELARPRYTSITVIWCHWQVNWVDLNRGLAETADLKWWEA